MLFSWLNFGLQNSPLGPALLDEMSVFRVVVVACFDNFIAINRVRLFEIFVEINTILQ